MAKAPTFNGTTDVKRFIEDLDKFLLGVPAEKRYDIAMISVEGHARLVLQRLEYYLQLEVPQWKWNLNRIRNALLGAEGKVCLPLCPI